MEFRFDALLALDKGRRLRGLPVFGRQIPIIERHIEEDILGSQSCCSGKVPDMDPCFLKCFRITASGISSAVHFMHSPKDNLEIAAFD
jgi:hypothetical protein